MCKELLRKEQNRKYDTTSHTCIFIITQASFSNPSTTVTESGLTATVIWNYKYINSWWVGPPSDHETQPYILLNICRRKSKILCLLQRHSRAEYLHPCPVCYTSLRRCSWCLALLREGTRTWTALCTHPSLSHCPACDTSLKTS